jgi:5-methyltetrahydropteroyltriglutamate--homocysteine methyltransferase
LIPGVIDSACNFVEHPRLIAQRIETYARVVGKERVIAGADCGFGTFGRSSTVYESVTWAKLAALGEGAKIASARLY